LLEREVEANLEEYDFDLEQERVDVASQVQQEFNEMNHNDDNIIALNLY